MFKRTISVRLPADIQGQLAILASDLSGSNLPAPTATYLEEQVELALTQFARHSKTGGVKHYNADRVFEGEGFRVIVKIRSRPPGLLEKLKKAIGLG